MERQTRTTHHRIFINDQQGQYFLVCESAPDDLPKTAQRIDFDRQSRYLQFFSTLDGNNQKRLKTYLGKSNHQNAEDVLRQNNYHVYSVPEDYAAQEKQAQTLEIGTVVNAQSRNAANNGLGSRAGESVAVKTGTGGPDLERGASASSAKATSSSNKSSQNNASAADKTATDKTPCQGDPISMVSGEELLPLTDFSLPGPIEFVWTRTYRSSNPENFGLGHGWTHPLCERLDIRGNKVEYLTREGRRIPFSCPRVGHTSYNKTEKIGLHRQSEHSYQIVEPQQPKRLFRADGIHQHLPLVEIRDSFNNSISIDYQQGLPRKLVTSWGRVLEFHTLDKGLIGAIHAPALAATDQPELAELSRYEYDDQQDLISAADQTGRQERYQYTNHVITLRTIHSGVSYHFEWDEHTPQARCQRQWSDNGAYDYRFKWQPRRKISYSTDSKGNVHEYHCDEHGRVVKEVDPEGGVTRRLYDSYGNLCSETNPNGHTTYYRHDALGQVTRITDALGNSTRIRYNHQGQPALITDALGNHWQRRYNDQGLLSEIRDPGNHRWQYQYNNKGQLETLIDPEGGKQAFVWNSQAELISHTDADSRTTEYGYDHWGRVNAVTAADGKTTRYQYNRSGKLTQLTRPDGHTLELSYNDAGQVIAYKDADGRTTRYSYGGFSQVERRVDANGQSFDYHYDEERNLTGLTNEKGERYTLQYDGNERLIEEIGFDGRKQSYHYDAAGHLTEHRDMDVVTQFTRDPLGRLLRKSNNSGDSAEFHYDALGRLTAANNPDAFVRYQYDNSGRLTAEHLDSDTVASSGSRSGSGSQNSNHSHSLHHNYDQRGWRTATSTDDHHLGMQYTPGGQLYGVDYNGNPVVRCEYDPAGRLSKKVQGSLTSQFQYDDVGQLLQQKCARQEDKNPVIQRDYKYSNAGNLQQIEDLLRGLTEYHYDHNDQLTRVEGAIGEAFNFDPAGNLLKDSSGQAIYEKGNRLTLHGDRHFRYDPRGNLVQEQRGKNQSLQTRYQYNGWNQLVSVESSDFKTHYRYDALGRRIGKSVTHLKSKQKKRTTFNWNGDQLLSETNHTPKGEEQQLYLFEPNSFRPLALIKNDEIHHYHLDHLGTPQEITNSDGDIVWQAQYKAYGQLAGFAEKPSINNPLRFQGQYFDSETGLHYNRHRYYDPSVGRFVHQDPVGLLGGNNNYQYAPNPIGWVDPLGLKAKSGDCPFADGQTPPITDPARLLTQLVDPSARANSHKVSVIVDESAFINYYVEKDGLGRPKFDANGNFLIDPDSSLNPGKYVTFTADVEGMNIVEARRATGTYSVPGRDDYRAYEGTNYRVDIIFTDDDLNKLSIPEKDENYLNDIGGPRAVGGARQRTTSDWIPIGEKVEKVTRLDPPINPTPE